MNLSASNESELEDFVESVELLTLHLESLNADLEVLENEDPLFEIDQPKYRWSVVDAQDMLRCQVLLGLHVLSDLGDETTLEMNLRAEYSVIFDISAVEEHPSDEVFDYFAANNSIFNAWPYFRETAHSLGGKMGFSDLVIPLFKKLPYRPEDLPDEVFENGD